MSGLMDDYNNRIIQFQTTLATLIKEYDRLPDAAYQVFNIEAEIRSFELRRDRLKLSFSHVNCNLCNQHITDEDEPVRLGVKGSFMICPRCIRTINQVRGTSELEELLDLKSGTVKQDCEGPLKPLQSECLIRKSEKCWLIHEIVADLFYRVGRRKHNLLRSWIDDLNDRLDQLKDQKMLLEELRSSIPDSHTQILSLQFQIQDLQEKVDRVTGGKLPYRCSQCNVWIRDGGNPTFFGTYTICSNCKEIITNVMTTSEAEKRHGLTAGTIRRDNSRGLLEKYKKHGLFRLSGKIWLIHEVVILDKYKELKSDNPVEQRRDIPSDLAQRSASIFNRIMESKRGD